MPFEIPAEARAPSEPESGFAIPADARPGGTPPTPEFAKGLGENFLYGMQISGTGLALRGEMPTQKMNPDAPWYERAAAGAGGMLADLPLSVVAGVAGGTAGTAVAPGAGTVVGAGAAAFGVPMALRDGLIEAYGNNHASSWTSAWEIAKATIWGGTKGAIIGGATAGTGRVVAPLLARTGGGAAATFTGTTAAELATMTTVAAGLEGHMPTAQDFMDNAILLGGFKTAMHGAQALRNIYADTGKHPREVVAAAERNPAIKAQLTDPKAPSTVKTDQAWLVKDKNRLTEPSSTDLKALTADIEKHGIKTPIEIRVGPEGRGYVIDGNNRLAAAKTLGIEDIPARFTRQEAPFTPEQMAKALPLERLGTSPQFVTTKRTAQQEADRAELRKLLGEEPSAPRTIPDAFQQKALEERVKAAVDIESSKLVADVVKQVQNPDAPPKEMVRYEYITDKATAESVVREVATKYAEHVEKQRRGTVKTEQSIKDGIELVKGGLLKAHEVGKSSNDAEIVARAALTRGAAERARRLAEEVANTPAELLTMQKKLEFAGALDQVRMFYGELAGAGAEAGRALRMLREIKRNPNLIGEAENMLKAYENGKQGSIQDIAAVARSMKTPEQMRKFAERAEKATGFEMFLEAWKAGLISGYQTTGANIFGNVGRWLVESGPTNLMTQTFEAARHAVKGDPMPYAVYRARVISPLIGLKLGALDSIKVGGEAWKQVTEAGPGLSPKLKEAWGIIAKGELPTEKGEVYKKAIPGTVGDIARLPFRSLQIQDMMFRTFGEREMTYRLAVERAAKERYTPGTAEFETAVQRYVAEPTLGLAPERAQEVTKRIEQHGSESVYAQRLGSRMETMSRAIQGSVGELIVPYRRTPINIASWAMQYTPILNFMSSRWWADIKAGGEAQSRALARVAIGTGLALAAFEMAGDGMITGSGLYDTELSRTKRGANWQPNSFFIDGKYYGMERMDPVGKIFITAANLHELMEASKDPEDKAKLGFMAVALFSNATISTTYLSGLSNTMATVREPQRYLDTFLEQYATSLVPKALGQIVVSADPHKREVDGIVEAIQSQLPYFRSKLLPARTAWGEPSENNKWFHVLPVATSEASQDKVKTEAVRLAIGIAAPPKFVTESGPLAAKHKRTELTAEQRNQFVEISGKEAMKILAPIVNAPDWERMPEYAQVEVYKRALDHARKVATFGVSSPTDAERQKTRERMLEQITKQTQAAQGDKAPANKRRVR